MIRLISIVLPLLLFSCGAPAYADMHSHYSFDEDSDWVPDVTETPFVGSDTRPFLLPPVMNGGETPLRISISAPPEGEYHFADVHYHNRLAYGPSTPNEYHFTFQGEVVYVYMNAGPGDDPDSITVIPPDGYIAIPQELTLEEGENGIVQIFPAQLG